MRIIILLSGLTALAAISTDMYLPAIPTLERLWQEPLVYINFALISFFISYSISILFFGSISDHFGRKYPLIIGLAIYCIGTLLCSISDTFYELVIFRFIQGIGAASAPTIAMAIAKDRFTDQKQRGKVLAYIAIIMALAPMLAPIAGAAVLRFFEWPGIFYSQALFSLILLAAVIFMPESIKQKEQSSFVIMADRYVTILTRHKKFIQLFLIGSLTMAPMFAFIASSSTIYQDTLGVSTGHYALLFALNASAIMIGNFMYLQLQKVISSEKIILIALISSTIGAVLLLSFGRQHVLEFALPMFLITLGVGISRTPSMNMALEQIHQHIGQASSLIVFGNFSIGAIAMVIASQEFSHRIILIACIALFCCLLSFWLLYRSQRSSTT